MSVSYLIKRISQAIMVMIGVSTIVFFLIHLTPGDPARMMLPEGASEEQVEEVRESLGLNDPLPMQYGLFLGRIAKGDLGTSFYYRKPVLKIILNHLPATGLLAFATIMFSLVVSIPLGIISAIKRNSILDYISMILAVLGQAMPVYWLGLILILVFAVYYKFLPTSGMGTYKHLILPCITLGVSQMALITRITRSGMLEILTKNYIRTARSKGLSEQIVIGKHALKNLLLPLITIVGMQLGMLLGGAVVTETVFGWAGVGQVAMIGIKARDYPLIQGVVLSLSFCFVILNLGVDLLYSYIDPRIKYK